MTPDRNSPRARWWRRSSAGQSILEMAVAVPVLVLLLVAVADLARVYYFAIELDHAARAGVQYGVRTPSTAGDLSGMEAAAISDAANISGMTALARVYCACPGSNSTFACSSSGNCSDERVYVEVDTSGTFNPLIDYPGLPSSLTIDGKAVMREQ